MTDRPVTETGMFSRSGFFDSKRASELIKMLNSNIDQDVLIENLSKVADPDNALLLLVRISDKKNLEFLKSLEND